MQEGICYLIGVQDQEPKECVLILFQGMFISINVIKKMGFLDVGYVERIVFC